MLEQWDRHLLVEASAGSGKTHSLVQRVVAGWQRGHLRPGNFLLVTFTRKAAHELRSRLRTALGDGPAFEQIFVGTFHAYCARLLQRFPGPSGLAPGFQDLNPSMHQKLLKEAIRECEPASNWRAFGIREPDLCLALERMLANPWVQYPAPRVELPTPCWPDLWLLRQQLGQLLGQRAMPDNCPWAQGLRRLLERPSVPGPATELYDQLRFWERAPGPRRRAWKGLPLEPLIDLAEAFRQRVAQPWIRDLRAHLYGQIIHWLADLRPRVMQRRRQRGLLAPEDLMHWTSLLLHNHPDVLQQIHGELHHILVDEFQDTDSLQMDLLWRLCGPATRLSLVGDPKQSIYRFRGADLEGYQSFKSRLLAKGGRVLALTASYRSRPQLCHWFNRVFSRLLPAGQHQPIESRVACGGGGVFHFPSESTGEEALGLARCILYLVNGAQSHRPGDFLILTTRRRDQAAYQRALAELGLACEAPLERAPLGPRARSVLPLLRHLVDPQDKAVLVGILRGPLFGHSDEELFAQVQAAGTLRPYPPGSGLAAVDASLAQLDRWRLEIRWLPPGAALDRLLDLTGLWSLAIAEGPASLAQLRGMLDQFRTSAERGLTLAEAVAELEQQGVVELPGSRLGQRDAVRVMNLHKAKGLEARVVILANPHRGFSSRVDHTITPDGQAFFSLQRWQLPLAQPQDWPLLVAQEQKRLEAEQLRLLYVAATRARETLVVCTHGQKGPWGAFSAFLEDSPEWTFPLVPPATARQHRSPRAWAADRLQPTWTRAGVAARGRGRRPQLPSPPLGVDARDWGRLVHRLLEVLARDPSVDTATLEQHGRWFCFDQPELARALRQALQLVAAAQEGTLGQWLRLSDQQLAEVPFGARRGACCVFGTMDLLLQWQGGWGLIEHKTDRQPLERLVATYARQLDQYSTLWQHLVEEPLRYAGIFAARESTLSPNLSESKEGGRSGGGAS